MDQQEFEEVFEREVNRSRDVLVEKAKEYASDGDRMHNFKVAAAFQGVSPEQALWGMATKHFVSLSDMIRSDTIYPEDKWDEKLGDALNYLILLKACILDSDQNREKFVEDTYDPLPEQRFESGVQPFEVPETGVYGGTLKSSSSSHRLGD